VCGLPSIPVKGRGNLQGTKVAYYHNLFYNLKNEKMKKFTHVTVGLLLALTMLSACKKNITDSNAIGGSNYQQQLNNRSALYKGNLGTGGTSHAGKINWKIIGADLLGALEGAATGSSFGPVGAGVGALIGGAGASMAAATRLSETFIVDTTKRPFTRSNTIGSAFNPYDNIGYFHYQCINEAFASPVNYKENNTYSNSRFYNFCSSYLSQQAELQPFQVQPFPLTASNSTLALVSTYRDSSTTSFLASLAKNKKISIAAFDALKPYLECLELTVNVGDFITYSLDAEKIIVLSTLSDLDKKIVLMNMSTARYTVQYWK
jgi:IS1 family transposase